MLSLRTFVLFLSTLTLAACASLVAPKTFIEQVGYAEATAQGLLQTVGDLTCTAGLDSAGVCLEPGKPLKPEQAVEAIRTISRARDGLKAAVRLPESGGECFGATRTPSECLRAVQSVLLEVERYLAAQGRK